MLRKAETLVFVALFIALPFFAINVVEHTKIQAAVIQTAYALVQDLRRSREIAKSHGFSITVTSRPSTDKQPAAYVIKDDKQIIEEVLLPPGVTIIGKVTFDDTGFPTAPASFIVTKASRTAHVDIDVQGITHLDD